MRLTNSIRNLWYQDRVPRVYRSRLKPRRIGTLNI